jgi:hypothetical protein
VRPGRATKGKWRIPDGKGESGLCRLRTDHLTPVNKIDYVMVHTGFMGSHKLSSFDGHRV